MQGGACAAGVPLAGQWHQGCRSSEDTNPVSRNMDDSDLREQLKDKSDLEAAGRTTWGQ